MDGIGRRLQFLRENKGLMQEDVSKKLNVSRSCVSSWERNRTEPNVKQVYDLAKLFDVSVGYLISGVDDTPSQNTDIRMILEVLPRMDEAALQQINRMTAYLIELNKMQGGK